MSDIEQDLHNMSFVEKPEVSIFYRLSKGSYRSVKTRKGQGK